MSYEFSFNNRTGSIMLGCLFVAGGLLLFAGFLVGMGSQTGIRNQSIPAVNSSVIGKKTVVNKNTGNQNAGSLESSVPLLESNRIQAAPVVSNPRSYCLQYGSFQQKKNAENAIKELKKNGVIAKIFIFVDSNAETWYVVRSGSYSSMDTAAESAFKIRKEINMSVLVRRSDAL